MDRIRIRPGLAWSLAMLVLISLACNLNTATPEAATAPPDEGVTTTEPGVEEVTFDYAPGIGSIVAWIDQSYVVYVPAGDFVMGRDEPEASDHAPAHTVSLDAFWIHQTEVTNRMYAACVEAGACTVPYHTSGKPNWYASPSHGDDPVVGVSWYEASAYCEWIEGRLPTEAEWEKAARGTEADPYPWGDEEPDCSLANFAGCQEEDQPVKVRSFYDGASPFLLADTAGNVAEWILDWFDEDYYAGSPASNPPGPEEGTERVVRGSHYDSPAAQVPVILREAVDPYEHRGEVGFRCVLSGETVGTPPPPFCEVPSYVPGPVEIDTDEPYPPDFALSSFCMPDADGESVGYVTLVFPEVVAPDSYEFSSSAPGSVVVTQTDDHTFALSGPGIPVDTNFDVTVCPAAPASPPLEEAVCPAGYYLDEDTGTCRYGSPSVHDTPGSCGPDELFVPGYGCLHACGAGDLICGCPAGYDFYEGYTPGDPPGEYTLCLPPDGPEDCLSDPNCSASTACPVGTTYAVDLDCCQLPEDVTPYCPPLYTLKISEIGATCEPPEGDPPCTSLPVFIPGCELACTDPSSYDTRGPCEAAGCRWFGQVAAAGGYCTFP